MDFVFGLARNGRLENAIVPELITATLDSIRTGRTARCFKDFTYPRWTVGAANAASSARPR